MSFSSRVISHNPPPVSPQIRAMGTILWILPILMAIFILIATPLKQAHEARLNMSRSIQAPRPAIATLPTLKPVVNREAGLEAPLAEMDRPGSLFSPVAMQAPVKAPFSLPSNFAAGAPATTDKFTLAVAAATPTRLDAPDDMNTGHPIRRNARFDPALDAEPRHANYNRVRAIGPTTIEADGVRIVLQDIEPFRDDAQCRRIDGILQSCVERAQHRLSILLQSRTISCRISPDPSRPQSRLGRCLAGQIDLAADLLRQKLVQRSVMRMAQAL